MFIADFGYYKLAAILVLLLIRIMTIPILLFLDINGVIDVEETDVQGENLPQEYSTVYPVPGAKEFLQVIDSCSWIHPVWISTWGSQSQAWNKWAKTSCWPSAYPLDISKIVIFCGKRTL